MSIEDDVLPGDTHFFGLTALVTVAMQLLFFFVAYSFKFDKVTDFAGGLNFVLLALLTLCLADTFTTRQVVLSVFVTVSRLELALILLVRVIKRGGDSRFDDKRDFLPFLGFWIFQMVWVWVVSLPVIFVNGDDADPALDARDYVGWTMWIVGFLLEMSSDLVKMSFRQNPENKGKFCDHGPWAVSRHPNYFGEILMWFGIFISSLPVLESSDDDWGYVVVLSPLLTVTLLLFLSGIPTAEGSGQKRYLSQDSPVRDQFLEYRNSVPPVFPFMPALYRQMPLWSKRLFCLELPMYEYHEDEDDNQHNGHSAQNGNDKKKADRGSRTELQDD